LIDIVRKIAEKFNCCKFLTIQLIGSTYKAFDISIS
jgi:hypothetical protein